MSTVRNVRIRALVIAATVVFAAGCSSNESSADATTSPATTDGSEDETPDTTDAPTSSTTDAIDATDPTGPDDGTAPDDTDDQDEPSTTSSPIATTRPTPVATNEPGDDDRPTTTATATATTTAATTATTTATTPTTPAASTATTSTVVAVDPFAADKAIARRALLTIDDFPDAWIEVPIDDEDDEADPELEEQFDACLGVGDANSIGEQLDGREVTTGEFTPDDGVTTVHQEVLLADDEAMAIAAMGEVGIEGAAGCMADVLQTFFETELATNPDFAAGFPEGMTVGEIIVERLSSELDPTVAVEYLVSIPLELDGDVAVFYLQVAYLRQGRALSQIQFQSFGELFDPEGIEYLTGETVDRLETIGT
jgi:hypothetical protein